jgi:hypothetical protein
MDTTHSAKKPAFFAHPVPWLFGALALVSLLVFQQRQPVSPAPAPAAPAAPTGAVDAPLRAGNWVYTVRAPQRLDRIPYHAAVASAPGGYLASSTHVATPKGEYVVVPVTLENVGKENFGVNAWDFELYDGAGVKYRPASFVGGEWAKGLGYTGEISVDTNQLPPGVSGTYVVVFDVTPGAQALRLRLVQAKTDVPL